MYPLWKFTTDHSTDLKDVEKQFESFFKLHYGIFKSRFFLFTTFIQKKLNYVKISFRCFYYLKTKEPFREPARIAKKVEKIQLFFSIRFDPNTWTIKLFTWKNVATGSKRKNPQNKRKCSDPYWFVENFSEWWIH